MLTDWCSPVRAQTFYVLILLCENSSTVFHFLKKGNNTIYYSVLKGGFLTLPLLAAVISAHMLAINRYSPPPYFAAIWECLTKYTLIKRCINLRLTTQYMIWRTFLLPSQHFSSLSFLFCFVHSVSAVAASLLCLLCVGPTPTSVPLFLLSAYS